LPIISLYVFAGYRLMPSLQQIYASLTQLTFVRPSLDKLFNDVNNLKVLDKDNHRGNIQLHEKIELKNVSFNYLNSSKTVLKNISLTIPNKSIVGFIGKTGSGKTTTVDIILGLLEAQKGNLKVDGEIISKKNSKAWQRSLGYVPQHIFLSDDTIATNIAFGIKENQVNQHHIERAAKIANLHDYIINELPEGYLTKVGERGIKLSGGQRQRIGIARAMYRNPQVLIFDEATSALDIDTEKAVMDAVIKLKKDITIILIAHRLNTIKNCDLIFKFEKGEIINQGKFNELTNNLENKKII
jgi:ABC-type multidrug transport system fused ATPase/permease subunit